MNELLLLLAQNGVLLVLGATLLLSLGCGAVMLCKSPVHRQRISELTMAGVLGWMVLALVPLPRLLPDSYLRAKPEASVVDIEPTRALDRASDDSSESSIIERLTEPGIILPSVERISGEHEIEGSAPTESFTGLMPKTDGLGSPSYLPSPSEESPRPPAPAAASASTPWQLDSTKLAGLFAGAYLAGASLCVLWIFAGYALLLRIRQSAEAPPEWLAKQYRVLAKRAGVASPRLIISPLCARPLTWGVLWPVVVLPRSLCRPENKSQLETILLHELGHIAQQDAQGNLLFCAALPLLFAHPLYWWLRRESQLAAELVADDWAAQQTGKETYVEELVALARCTGTSSLPLIGVTGLFSSPSQFYRRMHMLLAREKPLSTRTSLPWRIASLSALAGAVALAASLAGVRPVAGQTEPSENPPVVSPSADPPAITPDSGTVPALPTAPKIDTPPSGTTLELPPLTAPVAAPPGATPPPVLLPTTFDDGAQSAPADKEEAALLAEIKQLQTKLHALEAKRGVGNLPLKQPPGVKTITLVRDGGKEGGLWTEVWSIDEEGRTGKLISKTATGATPPLGLWTRSALTADGKTITHEHTAKDGGRTVVIVDAATGKVIAESRYDATAPRANPPAAGVGTAPKDAHYTPTLTPTPAAPAADPNVITGRPKGSQSPFSLIPGTVKDPQAGYGRATYPQPHTANSQGAQQLDLVSLATSYADAVSEVELAEAKMADIAKLVESKTISQQEAVAAKLAFSAAQRKEQLLRSIAEVAVASAAAEFERTAELHEKGAITAGPFQEAKTRMEILKQILRTRPAQTEKKP